MRFSLSWQRRRKGGARVILHTMERESCRSREEVSVDPSGGAKSGPSGHTWKRQWLSFLS